MSWLQYAHVFIYITNDTRAPFNNLHTQTLPVTISQTNDLAMKDTWQSWDRYQDWFCSATSPSCWALILNHAAPRALAKWSSTDPGGSQTDMHEFSLDMSCDCVVMVLRLVELSAVDESWPCCEVRLLLMWVHAEPSDLAKWSSTEPK